MNNLVGIDIRLHLNEKIAHERRKKDTFKIVSSLSFEMQKNNLLYVI